MFQSLPEPNRATLEHAPLSVAVFTLNFSGSASWLPQAGLRWRDALKKAGLEGKLVGAVQQQLTITGVQAQTSSKSGYQIQEPSGSTATLYEDALVVEERDYSAWPALRKRLGQILKAAKDHRKIEVVHTVGLRYVNALSDDRATSVSYWNSRVSSPFLGVAADRDLTADLRKSLSLLSFSDGQSNAEVRIGIQPDAVISGRIAYVFDMEFTNNEPGEFGLNAVLESADDLNTSALKLFQKILTTKYLKELSA